MPLSSWTHSADPLQVESEGSQQVFGIGLEDGEVSSPSEGRKIKAARSGKGKFLFGAGTTNKRWTEENNDTMLRALHEELCARNRTDKTFKKSALHRAALAVNKECGAVNKECGTNFDGSNVQNHLKHVRHTWTQLILPASRLSGARWNEEQKIITMDDLTHEDIVNTKRPYAKYINTPIHDYESMREICGDDHVRGYTEHDLFSSNPAPLKDPIDLDSPPRTGPRYPSSGLQSSGSKRRRGVETDFGGICLEIRNLGKAYMTGTNCTLIKEVV